MTPEFERLIEAAIADGTVTDKEREVLHRKARTLGLDTDEVDMIVEAKLHGVRSTSKPTKAMKCPQCGAAISGLTRVCQDCGHIFEDGGPGGAPDIHKTLANVQNLLVELRSIPAPGSAQDLDEQQSRMVGGLFGKSVPDQPAALRYEACLGKIENERRTMSIYFGSDPRVKAILAEIDSAIEKQKQSGQEARNRQQRVNRMAVVVGGGFFILLMTTVVYISMSQEKSRAKSAAAEANAAEAARLGAERKEKLKEFLGNWGRVGNADRDIVKVGDGQLTCSNFGCYSESFGQAMCNVDSLDFFPGTLKINSARCSTTLDAQDLRGCNGVIARGGPGRPGKIRLTCGDTTVIDGEFWH